MHCPNCGAQLVSDMPYCPTCGSKVDAGPIPQTNAATQSQPFQQSQPGFGQQPQPFASQAMYPAAPSNTEPLSVAAFAGYTILFCIPLVGFICLIVFSIIEGNVNRKNFARGVLIVQVVVFALSLILSIMGVSLMDAMY